MILKGNALFYWENVLRSECIWWHLSSIVTNCIFNQFRVIFTNFWNKKYLSIYFVILFFLFAVYTRNLFHCEGELLRVRLIIKNLPAFNFFVQEISQYWEYTQSSTRKIFYRQYVLFDLDIFSFLLIFCTRNYIHCDQNLHTFRLIIKNFSNFHWIN